MEELKKQAMALGQELLKSPCGRTYLFYLEKLEKKPELLEKIEEWKRLQLEYAQEEREGRPLSFQQKKRLSAEYEAIMMDPDGVGFLKSQIAFLKMAKDILEEVANQLPSL